MIGPGARCAASTNRSQREVVDGRGKRNRYIQLTGATKSVNRDAGGQDPRPGGLEGLHHQPGRPAREFVIDAYHQLWRIEKAFRMSKHDLQARPIYHRMRESIEAHLSIVVAAMAVGHHIEHQTGWSIKKFVRTARRATDRTSAPVGLRPARACPSP